MEEIINLLKSADDRLILYVFVFAGIRYLLKELDKRDKAIIHTIRMNTKAFNFFSRVILGSELGKDIRLEDISKIEDEDDKS